MFACVVPCSVCRILGDTSELLGHVALQGVVQSDIEAQIAGQLGLRVDDRGRNADSAVKRGRICGAEVGDV